MAFLLLAPAKNAIADAVKTPTLVDAVKVLDQSLLVAGFKIRSADKAGVSKEDLSEQEETIALAFRMILEELVVSSNRSASGKGAINDSKVVALLDLSLHSAQLGWVPKQLPFMCMHELFEGQTARRCGDAFEYLEQRVEKLKDLLEGDSKFVQAALLRCCNTLMQRLSKSTDLLLCGRVLMFLSHVLPLSERSGVNLKGEFNKGSIAEYEETLQGEEAERMLAEGSNEKSFKLRSTDEKLDGQMEVSFHLYKTFWGLQKHLHDPSQLLTTPGTVDTVLSGINSVLDNFSVYSLSDVEASVTAHSAEREFYFPGFLTSTKLVSLELQDMIFRRNVLVQYLIALHYLLDSSVHPPKSIELSKKEQDEVTKVQERCFRMLEGIPPKGTQSVSTLRKILDRENNWSVWKRERCPDFGRTCQEPEGPGIQAGEKRKIIERAEAETCPLDKAENRWKRRFFRTTVARDFIPAGLKSGGPPLDVCRPRDREDPARPDRSTSLPVRLQVVRDEADPEACIEEEYKKNNDPCWRWVTLRLLAAAQINAFNHATSVNRYLEGAVALIDGKQRDTAKAPAEDADTVHDVDKDA